MECNRRPNRSDIHLTRAEEAEIEAKTREYFDGVIPKRHSKPQRSDYSSQYVDDLTPSADSIPELLQFQRLEDDPHSLVSFSLSLSLSPSPFLHLLHLTLRN